jgi:hypothetical protein
LANSPTSSAPSNSTSPDAAAAPFASGHCSTIDRVMSRWLSSTPKARCFLTLVPIAMWTASKVISAFPMISRCPRVMGSNDPA